MKPPSIRYLAGLTFLLALVAFSSMGKPFQIEDLHKVQRISDAQLSPDNQWIAFSVATSDVSSNKMVRNLWIVPAAGGDARPLTFATKGSNTRPRWSPDSKALYFLSSRVDDTDQVFKLSLAGGEAVQVTHSPIAVDSFVLSPDGKTLALTASVFPEAQDLEASKKKEKEKDENPVKARLLTEVPFRRWDSWVDGKRYHIFIMALAGAGTASSPHAGGEAKDITPGAFDSPIWTEDGTEEVAFSPDSKEICFSRYTESEGYVGNSDLFTIPVTGGHPTQITTNRGPDTTPLYSPNGRYIAYTAGLRTDLETDQPRLFLYDRKTHQHINLTEELDRPIQSYIWTPDSRILWITLEDQANVPVFRLDVATKKTSRIIEADGVCGDVQISADGKFLFFSRNDFSHPAELFRLDSKAASAPVALTHLNAEALKDIAFGDWHTFMLMGWNDEPVQCWEIKPPAFDAAKKYPLLLFMHGGPETAWRNSFHYRWNVHLFAAAGYVVVAPNFHGSTSFGLKFMDAIKGQWGGAPFEDQMKAVDEALKWPYVDKTRLAAAGASYGGYMANWVAGHTDRFRTIVNHDGLYDLHNALFSCDFPGGIDKEFKGTPWMNPQTLTDQAPSTYAKNWKTPMLIIHGEKDYRVDPSNGFATFAVLQALKVPSKLLYYPDENHWVLHPANSILWYHTVLGWLDQWVKPDEADYAKAKAAWRRPGG